MSPPIYKIADEPCAAISNKPVQAIILAAGRGSRLEDITIASPKCLVRLDDRTTLLDHQLTTLENAGITKICVVTGYKDDIVQKAIAGRAEIIQNDRWANTNSLYSLWLCRHWVTGAMIVMNSDVLIPAVIMHQIIRKGTAHEGCFAYDSASGIESEHMKISLSKGLLTAMSKSLPAHHSHGENVGLLHFSENTACSLFEEAEAVLKNGGTNMWMAAAVENLAQKTSLHGVDIAGIPWIEIDYPDDLEAAQQNVWPIIRNKTLNLIPHKQPTEHPDNSNHLANNL